MVSLETTGFIIVHRFDLSMAKLCGFSNIYSTTSAIAINFQQGKINED
jgi:hypothetical protein